MKSITVDLWPDSLSSASRRPPAGLGCYVYTLGGRLLAWTNVLPCICDNSHYARSLRYFCCQFCTLRFCQSSRKTVKPSYEAVTPRPLLTRSPASCLTCTPTPIQTRKRPLTTTQDRSCLYHLYRFSIRLQHYTATQQTQTRPIQLDGPALPLPLRELGRPRETAPASRHGLRRRSALPHILFARH